MNSIDSTIGAHDDLTEIAVASNRLTAAWAGRIKDHKSTVFSGAGLWPLLGLLALGADEPGRTELAWAYGAEPDAAGTAARHFIDLFDRSPSLRGALGLWYHEDLPILDTWLDELPPSTRGRLDKDLVEAKARLDAWAREHTDGLIEQMPIDLDEDTHLVLASAIMVKTTWQQEFDEVPHQPTDGPWAGSAPLAAPLAALSRQIRPESVRVLEGEPGIGSLTIATVEGHEDIDVLLFLGETHAAPDQVLHAGISSLHSHRIGTPVTALAGVPVTPDPAQLGHEEQVPSAPGIRVRTVESHSPDIAVTITTPSFAVHAVHNLLEDPDTFGLRTVSDASAGRFPGISTAPLFVASAKQDAMAEFSKSGFKAAAVTAIAMSVGGAAQPSPMPSHTSLVIKAVYDRPFGFAAVHRPTGLVVVAGWVAEAEPYSDPTA